MFPPGETKIPRELQNWSKVKKKCRCSCSPISSAAEKYPVRRSHYSLAVRKNTWRSLSVVDSQTTDAPAKNRKPPEYSKQLNESSTTTRFLIRQQLSTEKIPRLRPFASTLRQPHRRTPDSNVREPKKPRDSINSNLDLAQITYSTQPLAF